MMLPSTCCSPASTPSIPVGGRRTPAAGLVSSPCMYPTPYQLQPGIHPLHSSVSTASASIVSRQCKARALCWAGMFTSVATCIAALHCCTCIATCMLLYPHVLRVDLKKAKLEGSRSTGCVALLTRGSAGGEVDWGFRGLVCCEVKRTQAVCFLIPQALQWAMAPELAAGLTPANLTGHHRNGGPSKKGGGRGAPKRRRDFIFRRHCAEAPASAAAQSKMGEQGRVAVAFSTL